MGVVVGNIQKIQRSTIRQYGHQIHFRQDTRTPCCESKEIDINGQHP